MSVIAGLWLTAALAAPPKGKSEDLVFDQVVLGELHGCGLRPNDTVACWGRNDRGQLGDVTFNDSAFPRPVADLTDVTALYAGSFHTCAVLRDRTVWCWGDNQSGQIGGGTLSAEPKPVQVTDLGPVVSLALGASHTCAVTTDKAVACWGNNLYGQLGLGTLRSVPRPVPVPGLPPITNLAAGYAHTCAAGPEGLPWCWGDASKGQLGRPLPEVMDPQPPAPVDAELPTLRGLEARGNQTCALHAEGVTCWGATPTDEGARPSPTSVVSQKGLLMMSLGWSHGCALAGTGKLTCWGDDRFGQLGVLGAQDTGVGAFGLRDAVGVAAGLAETCAPRSGGKRLACWGSWTNEELAAAKLETTEIVPTFAKPKLQLPPGVELLMSMTEVLGIEGAAVRITAATARDTPCANAKLDTVVETKKKQIIMKVGKTFLPGGDCIASPAPAVAYVDIAPGELGRRDVVVQFEGKEDFYQVFVTMDKIEVIPLQESVTIWEGAKALWRLPPGSMAITCIDHFEQPLCERRSRAGLPTCGTLLKHERITEVPQLKDRPYANTWFMSDPTARRISPDEGHKAYKTWFEQDWWDGSGCMDVRVRTWTGEVWKNR